MVKIDVLSDPVCPWCYIGKARLDAALAARPGNAVQVAWHPFQLNPDMPAGGMDRETYLGRKFGGPEAAREVYARIADEAAAAGLDTDLDAIDRTPNTLDAHRLIHWAGIEGAQDAVVDALFAAYFRDGRDIGDEDTLADIADGAGIDATVVRRLLRSDADLDEIRARDQAARDMGVTAVPTFIVADAHAVPGAQPTDLWLTVLDELAQAAQEGSTASGGAASSR